MVALVSMHSLRPNIYSIPSILLHHHAEAVGESVAVVVMVNSNNIVNNAVVTDKNNDCTMWDNFGKSAIL